MTDAPSMTPEESYNAALGIDAGAGQEAGQAPDQAQQPDGSQEQEAPRTNPNWDDAWKDVPDPIREQQRPLFERWDRDYQELQARFRPFQEYEQAGVTPTQLEEALQIQATLFENPREFYDRIGQAWGFTEQRQDLAQTVQNGQAVDPNEYDDPAVRAMAEQLQRQQQFIEQFQQSQQQQQQTYQQQQMEARNVAWTQNQMDAIESRFGQIQDADKIKIVERAILNANLGRNPSVEVAYHELNRERDEILSQAQRSAPRVLGGGGGQFSNAPAPVDYSKETPEERLARALQVAKSTVDSLNSAG